MQWSISDYKHDMGCKKSAPTDDEHHSHQGDIFDNGSPAFREHPSSSMVCKHISPGSLPFFCTGSPVPPPPQRCQVLNPFFFFSFLPFSFFVYKSGSSYLKQKRKKKEKQRNIFFVIYHLCAVYSYFSLNGTVASPSVGSAPSAAARSHPSFSTCAL